MTVKFYLPSWHCQKVAQAFLGGFAHAVLRGSLEKAIKPTAGATRSTERAAVVKPAWLCTPLAAEGRLWEAPYYTAFSALPPNVQQ